MSLIDPPPTKKVDFFHGKFKKYLAIFFIKKRKKSIYFFSLERVSRIHRIDTFYSYSLVVFVLCKNVILKNSFGDMSLIDLIIFSLNRLGLEDMSYWRTPGPYSRRVCWCNWWGCENFHVYLKKKSKKKLGIFFENSLLISTIKKLMNYIFLSYFY